MYANVYLELILTDSQCMIIHINHMIENEYKHYIINNEWFLLKIIILIYNINDL